MTQATVAGVIGGVYSLTGGLLQASQTTLTLSKIGKDLGNPLISLFSANVAGNVAQNIYEGRPALENSENVDPNQFIKDYASELTFGVDPTRFISNLLFGPYVDTMSTYNSLYRQTYRSSLQNLEKQQYIKLYDKEGINQQRESQNKESQRQNAYRQFSERLRTRRSRGGRR